MSKGFDLIKLAVGGAVVAGAVLAGSLVSNNMVKNGGAKQIGSSSEPAEKSSQAPIEMFDPITDEIRQIAADYEYSFDASACVVKEKEEGYKYADNDEEGYYDPNVASVPVNGSEREDCHLVYVFEGAYAEGYQGDYSETYAAMYLYDDGLFGGVVNSTNVRGYWYNSSKDAEDDEQDVLNLVSNVSKYESIICAKASGFYEWRAHIYLGFSWGTRSMEVSAYRYYPEVALAIDPSSTGTNFKVGDTFDRSGWVADRILKNLNYSSVFKASEVTWKDADGMLSGKKFAAAGDFEVTAKWNGLEASCTVHVAE